MLSAQAILHLHDAYNQAAHQSLPLPGADDPFKMLVLRQHQANFDLWHEEDKARDPTAPDSLIAQVKHAIDSLNQQRNDRVEQIDQLLLESLSSRTPGQGAALHSETPGLIIDRLSILSLKIFHTAEETARPSATVSHRARNYDRLLILTQQRDDLALCLDQLWQQVTRGERRFKLYRQMKMYNDPDLNPILYSQARRT